MIIFIQVVLFIFIDDRRFKDFTPSFAIFNPCFAQKTNTFGCNSQGTYPQVSKKKKEQFYPSYANLVLIEIVSSQLSSGFSECTQ